jgi:flagellin
MSLGVLNNLSAVYAENNLNSTNNSLSKTLQQLSSGSKINSGADDAAGLSLVNGLEANSTALAQSQTNATEGVGLLQVADGALSQVTSLLNRAVTLATEASNGTLNSSQDTAANQEYQSILSEISNIGSTTTFNNQGVFGTNTNIYTGDSSTAGASIDDLSIRSLSSANVGDTSGAISYNSGQGNMFYNLSTATKNASVNDTVGAETINVNILSNATGTPTVTPKVITTSAGATVQDLLKAINTSGDGLTATLATGAQAGLTGATATEMGIEITSSATLGSGTTPGVLGTLSVVTGDDSSTYITGGLSITGANGKTQTLTTTQGLTDLANQINKAGLGVSAVITQGGGNDILTLNSMSNVSVVSTLQDSHLATPIGTPDGVAFAGASPFYTEGINGTVTDATVGGGASTATSQAGTGGTATISYSDNAGQSLTTTDLSNQTDAQTALNSLNSAITDVAAQDGYIGAQINTLNAVSSVLSTQQENVTSAQNAVQATDYASATSNMSKYEILSQTGISALAQANSMQQEVTKLLQ